MIAAVIKKIKNGIVAIESVPTTGALVDSCIISQNI